MDDRKDRIVNGYQMVILWIHRLLWPSLLQNVIEWRSIIGRALSYGHWKVYTIWCYEIIIEAPTVDTEKWLTIIIRWIEGSDRRKQLRKRKRDKQKMKWQNKNRFSKESPIHRLKSQKSLTINVETKW